MPAPLARSGFTAWPLVLLRASTRRAIRIAAVSVLVLTLAPAPRATAADLAGTGRVRGRVVAEGRGEPIGFADVLLLPSDTTMKRIGGMTDAEGVFLLIAPSGSYSLQVRALSYRRMRLTNVVVSAGQLREVVVTLAPEAIEQEAIEVTADARHNNETALLQQRRKAATVGDAVSAEAVRRSADSDAGEVLRRVTGLSVVDNKFVFVRGMGERYSSTEVDGVRLASPEENKRVVPLDLIPASLLENVVIQKTYTADRPGEFGGGDVQVHTRDFPGKRSFSMSGGSTYGARTTFETFQASDGSRMDVFGFGASDRSLPEFVARVAGHRPIVRRGQFDPPGARFSADTILQMARLFRNDWAPRARRAPLGASYSENFGDERRLFGRALGIVQSATYTRSFDRRDEYEALYRGDAGTAQNYEYRLDRSTMGVQLNGMVGLSYRLTPSNTIHYRSLYTRDAEDEVMTYQGYNTTVSREVRGTRLKYVQRTVLSNALEGRHTLGLGSRPRVEWQASVTSATRLEPDRRETIFQENLNDNDPDHPYTYWTLFGGGGAATRMFGDLRDRGRGTQAKVSWPITRSRLRGGNLEVGGSHQHKERVSYYRRFSFLPGYGDNQLTPEEMFAPDKWQPGFTGPQMSDATQSSDNYDGLQELNAVFVSADLPLARRVRAVVGSRVEHGLIDVVTHDFTVEPATVSARGRIDETDVLPSLNLIVAVDDRTNFRVGASRTLSRPDMREMTPGVWNDVLSGTVTRGNPDLERVRIDNYDVRTEYFPGLTDVLAVGGFLKRLDAPIEQVIIPDATAILVQPENSESGRVLGVEFEARGGLERVSRRMRGLTAAANLSLIHSTVTLPPTSSSVRTREHPLQGQSDLIANGSIGYVSPARAFDLSLLANYTGRRLQAIGRLPRPDRYEDPRTTLDAALNWLVRPDLRIKLVAKNITDARVRILDGAQTYREYRPGTAFGAGLQWNVR